MKKNLILDAILLLISITLLMGVPFGLVFHEYTGVVLLILIVLHTIWHLKWLKATTKRLFAKNTKINIKLMYVSAIIVLIGFIGAIISGIMMSEVLFPGMRSSHSMEDLHELFRNISLFGLVFHLAVNAKIIFHGMKRIFK